MPLKTPRPQRKKGTYFGSIGLYIICITSEGLTGLLLCPHSIIPGKYPSYVSESRFLHVTSLSRILSHFPCVMTKESLSCNHLAHDIMTSCGTGGNQHGPCLQKFSNHFTDLQFKNWIMPSRSVKNAICGL